MKKTGNKLLSLLLACVFVLGLLPMTALAATAADEVEYIERSWNGGTVTATGGNGGAGIGGGQLSNDTGTLTLDPGLWLQASKNGTDWNYAADISGKERYMKVETEPQYPIWVGGVQVTSANAADVLEDGKVKFEVVDGENILTLKNANITDSNSLLEGLTSNIYVGEEGYKLTLNLIGTNTLSGAEAGIYCNPSYFKEFIDTLTITGSGSLNASGTVYAIAVKGKLVIDNTTVRAKVVSGQSTISEKVGIHAYEIEIEKSHVEAEGPKGIGVANKQYDDQLNGDITITDSTVTANGGGERTNCGIFSAGKLTIGGDSIVSAKGKGKQYGAVSVSKGIFLNDNVCIQQPAGGKTQQDNNSLYHVYEGASIATDVVFVKMCTVTFKNEDGNVLGEAKEYALGTPAADIVRPDEPVKAADVQYTYTFAGWSPAIAEVTGDATYTATYTKTLNKYTVTFVDEDGKTVLKEAKEYDYGTAAADIEKPDEPTKGPDAEFHYTFSGWNSAPVDVTADATYTATYAAEKHSLEYTTAKEATCTAAGEKQGACSKCDYETTEEIPALSHDWGEWEITTEAEVGKAGEKTRTCSRCKEIETEPISALDAVIFRVSFAPGEGSGTMEPVDVAAGTAHELPACTFTAPEGKTFDAWTIGGEAYSVYKIEADTTAVATWKSIMVKVGFASADGAEVSEKYDEVAYGADYVLPKLEEAAIISGLDYGDATLDYWQIWEIPPQANGGGALEWGKSWGEGTIGGEAAEEWKPSGSGKPGDSITVKHDTILLPVFAEPETFTVTFCDEDQTELQSVEVKSGETPEYTGAMPTKAADSSYTYTFAGWTPEIVPATADATYTATYTRTAKPAPTPYYPIYVPPEPELPFTDVTKDMDIYDDVKYVYEKGIMIGVSDTLFGPELSLTRGMIVTILHRMEDEPKVPYSGVFSDVPAGQWYTDGVEWAASVGIVLGYGDGTYGTTDNVTREQLVTILYRYAQWKDYAVKTAELKAEDAKDVSDWAAEAMAWAAACGVLKTDKDGSIRPGADATRGEIAEAIHVFLESVAR